MTKLLVLGLLDEQPMSGYDIQQKISGADAERWGGVLVGSIYHALKKLEQANCIELASIEQTGHRQKAVYKITDTGKKHLQLILLDALRGSSVRYPTILYSGLSLLNKLPKEDARQALKEQLKLLNKEYDVLEHGKKANETSVEEIPLLSRITIDNMYAIIRQQQEFIVNILKALEGER